MWWNFLNFNGVINSYKATNTEKNVFHNIWIKLYWQLWGCLFLLLALSITSDQTRLTHTTADFWTLHWIWAHVSYHVLHIVFIIWTVKWLTWMIKWRCCKLQCECPSPEFVFAMWSGLLQTPAGSRDINHSTTQKTPTLCDRYDSLTRHIFLLKTKLSEGLKKFLMFDRRLSYASIELIRKRHEQFQLAAQ